MNSNRIHIAKAVLIVLLLGALLAYGTGGIGLSSSAAGAAQSRELRVANNSVVAGQNVSVAIELVSLGNENALGFSLNFNPAIFSNPMTALGSAATGGSLFVNTSQVASGRLGLAVALATGQTFAAGTRQIAVVTFAVAAGAATGATSISFGDQPIPREVSDANAGTLTPVTYTPGTITVQQPNPVPALTSLNPTSATAGSGGFPLTVNGSNFVSNSTVRWNGSPRTTAFVSSTQLTATIPASDLATAGTASVTVVNPTPGGGTSNSLGFTINNPAPVITSLSPSSATAGGAGFTLTVNGSGFVSTSSVWWNGAGRTTTFVSSTQLTAQIPASDLAVAGTAGVTIVNPSPGGGTSAAATFTINNPAPFITSLVPSSATAGGAGFTLTINGSGFLNTSTVWWNGAGRTATFVNSAQLTAAIPAGDLATAGTANVAIVNPSPGGGTSPAAVFTINPAPPVIASLTPNGVLAGAPAFNLTVTGSGFVNNSVVNWNGSPRATTFNSATQLTASIPAGDVATAGTASVTVVNPAANGGASAPRTFTISQTPLAQIAFTPPAPRVNDSITARLSGTWPDGCVPQNPVVTIGSGAMANEIRIDTSNPGQVCATVLTDWNLTALIGQLPVGTYSVRVFHTSPSIGGQREIGRAPLTVSPAAPAITTLNPTSATAGGAAFTLTVNGSNFANGAAVLWNGSARTTSFVSATQLTAAVTAADIASPGVIAVTVSNPAPGGGTSNSINFTINPAAPTLANLSPNSAISGGAAFPLTVNGGGFTSNSIVQWNGSARATTFVSATQLRAQITAADIATAGTASVTVVTPAPGGGTSNALTFAINSPVASVSAASFLGAELAAESIVAAFGVNLATSVEIANTTPLPTTLAGTKVTVRDSAGAERLSPLFFVAPSQVNYQMPPGTANGAATVTITSGDGKTSIGTQQIASVAPGLFTANANGLGVPAATVFRLRANGTTADEPLARFDSTLMRFVPLPIDLGPEGDQVFAVLFGTGFRNNTGLANVSVKIGGTDVEVLYAGVAPGFVGLDQCNARIPRSLMGRGEVDLVMTVNGKVANTVRINIK